MDRQGNVSSSQARLTDHQLEAGVSAIYEWHSLGGLSSLGAYDLVRRLVVAVAHDEQCNFSIARPNETQQGD